MKASRNLKKPILLVIAAILCMAVIASVAVTTVLAADTPTATLSQYQVGMRGNLNLRFIYSAVGTNTVGFKAQVGEDTYSYTLDQVKSGDNYVVVVPLSPAEVAADVTVWPVAADGTEGEKKTYSVKEYANAVLANEKYAEWHGEMTALLNWGAKSEAFYGTPGTTADGLFGRDTDPAANVDISIVGYPKHTVTLADAGTFTAKGSGMSLILDENNISLAFRIASTSTSDTLKATITRGSKTEDVTAVKEADGRYAIYINNITTKLFYELYTVTITDESGETFTAQASVNEYLHQIIKGNAAHATKPAEQKAVAQSLFRFYQQTVAGAVNAATCNHGSHGAHFNANGDYICSNCLTVIKTALPEGVTAYVPGGMMAGSEAGYWTNTVYVADENEPDSIKKDDKGNPVVDQASSTAFKTNPWVGHNRFNMKDTSVTTNADGSQYFSFTMSTGHDTTSEFIWNRDNYNGNSGHTWPNEKYITNVGAAQYFVVKARLSENEDATFRVNMSTTHDGTDDGRTSIVFNSKAEKAGEWVTYVLPLSLLGNSYKANTDGTYTLDTFFFQVVDSTSKPTVDIEYFAFAETVDDVEAIVDQDTVVLSTASGHGFVTTPSLNGMLITPEMIKISSVAGSADREIMTEDGVEFVRIDNNGVNTDNWSGINLLQSSNTAVTGQYLIMKIRIGENGLSQTLLTFYTVTSAAASWAEGKVDVKVSEDGEWHVIVVDLAARCPAGKFVAEENGTYIAKYLQMRQFTGAQTTAEADDYMDVAYLGFVSDLADVKNFVSDATYEYSTSKTTFDLRNTSDNKCAGGCKPTVKVEDESTKGYTLVCPCGATRNDNINFYATNVGGYFNNDKTSFSVKVTDTDGTVYTNLKTNTGTHHDFATSKCGGNGSYTDVAYKTGQYWVIRMRGTTSANLAFKISTIDKNPGWTSGNISNYDGLGSFKPEYLSETEWRTYVIKVSDTTTNYTLNSVQRLALFTTSATVSDLDIEYTAMADTLADLKTVIKDDAYYYFDGTFTDGYQHRDIATDDCYQHVTTGTPTKTTVAEGTKYTYTCSACGKAGYEKVVPAAVTAYVTPKQMSTLTRDATKEDKWAASTHFSMAGQKIEQNGNVPYFTFEKGTIHETTSTFIWNRDNAQGTGERSSYEVYETNVGHANYLVIKMRVADNAQNFQITLSTKGTAENYFNNDTSVPYGDPRVTHNLQLSATANGEWATYVLDLEKVYGDAYNPSADGTYLLDTFYFNIKNEQAASYIDIEYFSFIKSDLASLKGLIDDSEFRLIEAKDDKGTLIVTEKGECVTHSNPECGDTVCNVCGAYAEGPAHTNNNCDTACDVCSAEVAKGPHTIDMTSAVDTDGNTVYTTNCTGCDEYVSRSVTVPKSVNFYCGLNTMGWWDGKAGALTRYLYDETNGVLYNNIITGNGENTHINITGDKANSNGAVQTLPEGKTPGKYIVIKYRTNGMNLSISAVGSSKDSQADLGSLRSDGAWKVSVIDINSSKLAEDSTTMYIMFLGNNVDIAYVATVDTLTEAAELITDAEFTYHGASAATNVAGTVYDGVTGQPKAAE